MAKKLKLWFDKALAEMLSEKITAVDKKFNSKAFIKAVDKGVRPLELKARVELIADLMHQHLGEKYPKAIRTILKILGPENPNETGMFTEFYWLMPAAKYVEKYGLDDYDLSIKAIKEITKRHTSEYTIRPYIRTETKKTLTILKIWVKEDNLHVRRLACEGVRPKLPWARKLDLFIKNPKPILPILNSLKDDPSKYVQKSVANCINDILKDNPETGKTLIEKWNSPKKISPQRKWIIKHALRNHIKKEDPWALKQV